MDGVVMELPLGPVMVYVFLSFYEVKWLEQYTKEYKAICYRRYVNDIFVLFESAEHRSKFRDYFDTCHPNISFSFEQKRTRKLSFLDAKGSTETPVLKVSCQQYRNLVWFILLLIVYLKFALIGQSFVKNLVL